MTMTQELSGYTTLKDAATVLKLKHNTLYRRVKRHGIQTLRIGRVHLVRLEDITTTRKGV